MKRIKSTISYTVPNWNFCNSDNLTAAGKLTDVKCRFCTKTKSGYSCVLYDVQLASREGLIYKPLACRKATAGFESVIDEPAPVPTVQPKDLMKQAIDLYNKTVAYLINQGYPRQIAENVAKQHILGG